MDDFQGKMVQRIFAHSTQLGLAETEAVIRHCLWSQDKDEGRLLAWLMSSSDEPVVFHIAGIEAKREVLELHPDGPITVRKGPSVREAFGIPFEEVEYLFGVSKSDAMRIVAERIAASDEQVQGALQSYAEIVAPRFQGEPFVHLTVGKRAFPIMVPFKIDS